MKLKKVQGFLKWTTLDLSSLIFNINFFTPFIAPYLVFFKYFYCCLTLISVQYALKYLVIDVYVEIWPINNICGILRIQTIEIHIVIHLFSNAWYITLELCYIMVCVVHYSTWWVVYCDVYAVAACLVWGLCENVRYSVKLNDLDLLCFHPAG